MEKAERRTGKVFNTCVWILLITVGFFPFSVLTDESKFSEAASSKVVSRSIDQGVDVLASIEDKASSNRLESEAVAHFSSS